MYKLGLHSTVSDADENAEVSLYRPRTQLCATKQKYATEQSLFVGYDEALQHKLCCQIQRTEFAPVR